MSAPFWLNLTVAVVLPSLVFNVIVAIRCLVAVFSSAVTVTCALPLPSVALSLTQAASEVIVQSVLEVTVNVLDSDLAVKVMLAGETESVALAPACFTVTGTHSLLSLQKTMTPSRATVEVLASALNEKVSVLPLVVLSACFTHSGCELIL